MVRKIELDEKQGDKTVMQFREVQTGKPLDDFAKKSPVSGIIRQNHKVILSAFEEPA